MVEALTRNVTIGLGYKIVGFNTVLKMRGSGKGISNDLTVNADFSYQQNQALIRRIESNYTQATSVSKRVIISAFFDHQVNTPLISANAYPTSNTAYGITFNLNLAR